MEFKLFDDYITLQALLKTTGILHSGGAIKGFLEENTILFNGEDEKRRGKKEKTHLTKKYSGWGHSGYRLFPPSDEVAGTDHGIHHLLHP